MKTFLAAVLLVALCVLGLCANILLKKNGEFPQYDVGSNEEMHKRGITCFKDQDALLHGKRKCTGKQSAACEGCTFNEKEQ